MTHEDREKYIEALRILDRVHMQCNRVLRKSTEFYQSPDAYTRANLNFEIQTLKEMLQ